MNDKNQEKEKEDREKPGPKPERLNLDEEDWEEAVKKIVRKDSDQEG